MRYDVIVVGGGPAGVTAALRARELGASVALIERGLLGGTCTNDGCAPTRVLAKTARLLRDTQKFDEYGLAGERPVLDWTRLRARTHYVVNALHEKKQMLGHLQESGIATVVGVGDVRFVDAHTLETLSSAPEATQLARESSAAKPARWSAEKFIIAAGGHARRLNFPGAELALTHSDVWTLDALPRRAAIVGAAATGCQLASVLEEFGAQVTLLDVAPRILPAEDEATSSAMRQAFEARGMRVETSIGGIARLEREGKAQRLVYIRDGQEIAIDTDAVIVAVGWVGNLDSLNLEAAGVRPERGYIVVNDQLQTSAPNIYAAGDITGRMMLVQSATNEGIVAAENAVLGAQETFAHRVVPHGGFTDPEYGSVGLTEAQARAQDPQNYLAATVSYAETDRAVIDDQLTGFCKLLVARDTREVLGAHVVGEQALEVTQMVAAAMAARARVGDLAQLEIAYPTYAAIVGLAARRIVRELGFKATQAPWRALGRIEGAEWERAEG